MLDGLTIHHLRCLRHTPFVRLRPITLLVGMNGSGKSTFCRVLPLLRQSVEERTRGPILWYGNYVDFGTFQDAISRTAEDTSIEFGFRVPITPSAQDYKTHFLDFPVYDTPFLESTTAEVRIALREESPGKSSYTSQLKLQFFSTEAQLNFDARGGLSAIRINEYEWKPSDSERAISTPGYLLPSFQIARRRRSKSEGASSTTMWFRDDPLRRALREAVRAHVHGNTSSERIAMLCHSFRISSDKTLLNHFKSRTQPLSWHNEAKRLNVGSKTFSKLRDRVVAWHLQDIIAYLDRVLYREFSGVRYIEPLRATAQRYYRQQELSVEEIDSKGANIAMYLDSLPHTRKQALDTWMSKHFQFVVEAYNEGGHVALKVRDEDVKHSFNVSDMGFGFSQILPIAVQLWAASHPDEGRKPQRRGAPVSTIVIEQPELHLHPDFQARVSDVLAAVRTSSLELNGRGPKLVVETHSPHIVNRLGELISDGMLNKDDVGVVLFERHPAAAEAEVKVVEFDEDGVLKDWPFGFFEPSFREV